MTTESKADQEATKVSGHLKRGVMQNTGVMCMITVNDNNAIDGIRHVDMGNYYKTETGEQVVVTTKELAQRYHKLIDDTIYVRKA